MKLLHISDLHIGKKVNEISMLEEQKHILQQILNILKEDRPDYLILAGDIYDKPIPSVESVEVLDDFLYQIAQLHQKTILISGNHDSAERLGFAHRLFQKNQIYVSTAFDGKTMLHTDADAYGSVDFYMIPFIKPIHIRRFFESPDWKDYTDMYASAIRYIEENRDKPASERKVLIAHQFITGASVSDSEEMNIGGLDNISAEILDDFDYVALGHIHGPQQIRSNRIRYSGSICKYSFSEEHHVKSALLITLGKPLPNQKCEIDIKALPLVGTKDFRTLRGTYEELSNKKTYQNTNTQDYIRVILTDEEDQPDAFFKLRAIYPNLMSLEYDNARTKGQAQVMASTSGKKSPLENFAELYFLQNNKEMSEEQREYIKKLLDEIFEEK